MSNIHVNTDSMRHLGSLYNQLNLQLQNQMLSTIQTTISHLESDWQGSSRIHYEQLFQEWQLAAKRIIAAGENIGNHLTATAERFDQADNSL